MTQTEHGEGSGPKMQEQGAGGARGGRRRRGQRRVMTSLAEINVVPMVDVMLVLLIIFMVAAPLMQRGLDVNLPVARRADPIAAERLFVTIPLSFRTDRIVQVGDDPVRVEILDERMRQELLERTDQDVFLRGDREITLQELMVVMDELKEGGVATVGLVTDFVVER
ncbi:MAG: biopolymer transporter ExbD [Acidobacteria bacterium]|nr:biopolymer transporter ExbD [Acidobacteriota bacterium]